MKKTDNTNTLGSAQTRQLTKTACCGCSRLETLADALVGWCPARSQYRSTAIERTCGDFRSLKTEDMK